MAALKRIRKKENRNENAAKPEQEKGTYQHAVAIRILATPPKVISLRQGAKGTNKDDDGEHALNERRMADATEGLQDATFGLRNFTVALVFIAIVGAVISFGQWWEIHSGGADTSKLAEAAVKQANAAEKQISVLRANMRQEPIIAHPSNAEGKQVDAGQQFDRWIINPIWKNVGGTDARNVYQWWKITIISRANPPEPADINWCPELPEPLTKPEGTVISPGNQIIQYAQVLPVLDAMNAMAATEIIYFHGHIEYNDIFLDTPRHHFDWCDIALPNDINKSIFSLISVYQRSD